MRIAGLDIATTTGFALIDGDEVTASSFKAKAKRPFGLSPGAVDWPHEGAVAREFRDWLRSILVAEGIEAVGIERPMPLNVASREREVVQPSHDLAGPTVIKKERTGATNAVATLRTNLLVGHACEICKRLEIPVEIIPPEVWRKSFLGFGRAPKGTTNGRDWLKAQAKAQCQRLQIKVPNIDAAEAVGIAWHMRGLMSPAQARLFAAAE